MVHSVRSCRGEFAGPMTVIEVPSTPPSDQRTGRSSVFPSALRCPAPKCRKKREEKGNAVLARAQIKFSSKIWRI